MRDGPHPRRAALLQHVTNLRLILFVQCSVTDRHCAGDCLGAAETSATVLRPLLSCLTLMNVSHQP